MIYNRSNIARTLNAVVRSIAKIQEFWKVCLVVVTGQRATFVSKKLVRAAFVNFRKEGARKVVIARTAADTFRAVGRDDVYTVTATATAIECECQDYKNQLEQFGKGVCKHGYRALGILGYDSLTSYLATA